LRQTAEPDSAVELERLIIGVDHKKAHSTIVKACEQEFNQS